MLLDKYVNLKAATANSTSENLQSEMQNIIFSP